MKSIPRGDRFDTCFARRWRSTASSPSPRSRFTSTWSLGNSLLTEATRLWRPSPGGPPLLPFFPAVGGRALTSFEWRGHPFWPGDWFLLDLYGTDHDPRIWTDPETFRPERFLERDVNPFQLIPQGGGDHRTGHRCSGEWSTVALVKRAARLLTTTMTYDVPDQDLTVRLNRFPTQPTSRFVMTNVRAVG